MGLTVDLNTKIAGILRGVFTSTTVFRDTQTVPDALTLYCTFGFPDKINGKSTSPESRIKTLQIDVWYVNADANLDTIDNAVDAVETALSGKHYIETTYYFTSVFAGRNDHLDTDEANVYHSRINFDIALDKYNLKEI